MKEQKKRHFLYQFMSLAVFMLIGAAFGVWMSITSRLSGSCYEATPISILILLLIFYIGVLIQTILHEAGHLLFGLITGYRFLSFRVLHWTWVRQNGKIVYKKYSLPGTLGQCLLSPPEGYDDMADAPYALYHLGGVLVNLFLTVLFMILSVCLGGLFGKMVFTGLALAGFITAFSNGIPNEPGRLNNDARNLLELRRSPDVRRDMMMQLQITALQAEGMRLKDMPEDLFKGNAEAAKSSMISATIFAFQENRFMDEHSFVKAGEMIDLLSENTNYLVSEVHRRFMRMDQLYLQALSGNSPDVNKTDRKLFKAYRSLLSVCRTEYVLSLSANDQELAERKLADFARLSEDYPYPGELASEQDLVSMAQQKIGGLVLDNSDRIQ